MTSDIEEKALEIYDMKFSQYLSQGVKPDELRQTLLSEIEKAVDEYWDWYQERETPQLLFYYEVWSTLKENLDGYLGDMLGYKIIFYSNNLKLGNWKN